MPVRTTRRDGVVAVLAGVVLAGAAFTGAEDEGPDNRLIFLVICQYPYKLRSADINHTEGLFRLAERGLHPDTDNFVAQ